MKELKQEMLELAEGDAAEARRMQAALEALAPAGAELPAGFNGAVRAAVMEEARGGLRRGRRRWGPALGYAAMLAAGVLLGGVLFSGRGVADPLGASVSWAQVVQAVEMVPQFHATFIADEPHNSPDAWHPPLYRLDWYYRQPGLMRAQGLGYVQFANGNENRMYSIKDGTWVDPKTTGLNFSVAEIGNGVRASDFLTLVLRRMFRDKVPVGEPVKNADLTAAGIEVFDYATAPGEQWARIWVLKASRMPLRIKVFQPQNDSSQLVEFDYTDPQPAAFFDAEAFAAKVSVLPARDVTRVYAIGSEPLAGKPTGRVQIHAVMGGYHAPTMQRALSNDQGDVALFTSRTMNVTEQGTSPLDEEYRNVTDNWGNRFLGLDRMDASWGSWSEGSKRWYFVPVPPYKVGTGVRRLTADYVIRTSEPGRPGASMKVLATQTIEVMEPTTPVQRGDWPAGGVEKAKASALRTYIQSAASLADQLAMVEGALAKDPASEDALAWKLSLYRQYGREAQAWELYEKTLLPRVVDDAASFFSYEGNIRLAQYMIYLARQERWSEFDALVPKIEKLRDERLASAKPDERQWAQTLFKADPDRPTSLIRQVLALQACRAALRDHPPAVVGAMAAKDGMVCEQLRVPLPPEGWQWSGQGGSDHYRIDYGWCWAPYPTDGAWQTVGHLSDPKTGDVWVALAPMKGAGNSIKVGNTVQIIRDNYYTGHVGNEIEHPWSVTANVPAATVDSLEAWWKKNTEGKNATWYGFRAPPPEERLRPVDGWLKEAGDLRKARQWDEAIALYNRIVLAPDEAWPEYYTRGDDARFLLANARREAQEAKVQVLVEAGRMEEARREIDAMRGGLPAKVDLQSEIDTAARTIVHRAQLEVIKAEIAGGKVAEARAALEEMGKGRPDLAPLSDDTEYVSRGNGMWTSVNIRQMQRDAWREYDTVWWEAQDAAAR